MTWMPITLAKVAKPKVSAASVDLPPVLEQNPPRSGMLALAVLEGGILFAVLTLTRVAGLSPTGSWMGQSVMAALAAAATVLIFALCELYQPHQVVQGWMQGVRIIRAWAILMGLGVLTGIAFGGTAAALAPLVWITVGLLGISVLRALAWRPWLRTRFGRSLRGSQVIVGTGALARRMAIAASKSKAWGPVLVGFVDELDEESPLFKHDQGELPAPYLGSIDRIRDLAEENRISHVLVAREDLSRGRLVELANQWLKDDLKVSLVSSAFEVMVARASASMLGGLPLAILQQSPQRGWRLQWKRALDVSLVLLGGILLLPILAVVAAAIKLSSPGPVLFKQDRVGRNGKVFKLYKFRSMLPDNDDRAHRLYVEALIRGEPAGVKKTGEKVYKLVNDPRVTPLGRFLRATSLDEFPQLWNVFRGDMSLVGPRPCLPYEWELYEDWQRSRLQVLPGITGLWQVSGRSQVPFEEMVLLDLHYIANWSLSLDIALLFRTVPVVVTGSGGH